LVVSAHPIGHGGSRIWFGGLGRQQHANDVTAAFVQLAGEVYRLCNQLRWVAFIDQLGAEFLDTGLLVDQIVEGEDKRGL
jgi:hypothetical protein